MPLITSPYISRVLGAEQIGIYAYTYSVAYYFMMFAMLGIRNYGNRVVAGIRDDRNKLNREFSSIMALHVLQSAIMLVLYILYCLFLAGENRLYAFIQAFWVLGALFDINWFFGGMEQFKLTVTRNAAVKILTVLSIFVFVRDREDLWVYVAIMAVGSFLSQSVVWLFVKRYVSFVRPTWSEIRRHVKPMLMLFVPIVAVSLYKFMAKIMLGAMGSNVQVGLFENADKAIGIPTNIIVAFGVVMMPRMSHLAASGDERSGRRYISESMLFVMCLAMGMSFGIGSVAQRFSDIMWGREFAACGELIRILASCTVFMSFANILRTQYIIPRHMDHVYIISVCAGAVINIAVNLMLIPRLQAVGAAIGTVSAEAAVCCIQTVFLVKRLPMLKYVWQSVVFGAFGAVMSAVVFLIDRHISGDAIALVVEIMLGIVVYAIQCASYFLVTKNETIMKLYDGMKHKLAGN